MLSVIGLALDALGAMALASLLFRGLRRLSPGFGGLPEEAAQDYAAALVGTALLVAGFIVQSLPYLGVRWEGSSGEALGAWFVTLGAGGVCGYALYKGVYCAIHALQRRRARPGPTPVIPPPS